MSKIIPDFFHSLEVISDDDIQSVGDGLVFFVVLEVSLSVQEPNWNSVSDGVFNDFQDLFFLFFSEFSGSINQQNARIRKVGGEGISHSVENGWYLMLGSTLAILQIRKANLRPIPLISLRAKGSFLFPVTFVL